MLSLCLVIEVQDKFTLGSRVAETSLEEQAEHPQTAAVCSPQSVAHRAAPTGNQLEE